MNPAARLLAACALACTIAATAQAGGAAAAAPSIVGTWRFDLPGFCAEIYRVRADGTMSVNSGEEFSEEEFEISPAPSDKGFFKFTSRIRHTNGKPDCTGSTAKTGDEATVYIRFHPDGDMMLFCRDESAEACVGPLLRIADEAA
jgi:hypothetical protein